MSTVRTKRYILNREDDASWVAPANTERGVLNNNNHPSVRRMRIYVWDLIEEKEVNLPRYTREQIPTVSDLIILLEDYCDELNKKHEDDLLYLNIVKGYIEDE